MKIKRNFRLSFLYQLQNYYSFRLKIFKLEVSNYRLWRRPSSQFYSNKNTHRTKSTHSPKTTTETTDTNNTLFGSDKRFAKNLRVYII